MKVIRKEDLNELIQAIAKGNITDHADIVTELESLEEMYALDAYIEECVPWRLENIQGLSKEQIDKVKDEITDELYNDADVMFDFEKFDEYLEDKIDELL